MKFQEFVISLRRRLQDVYASSGSEITTLTSDGIRWKSSELIEVCNSAILELLGLIILHKKSPLIEPLLEGFSAYKSSETIENGIYNLQNYMFDIISLRKTGGIEYARISPSLFDQYVSSENSPRKDSYYYTVFYNPDSNIRQIRISPSNSADRISFAYIYGKTDYLSTDSESNIFLNSFSDMLLDLAESECRSREKNWERAQYLSSKVINKIAGGKTNE